MGSLQKLAAPHELQGSNPLRPGMWEKVYVAGLLVILGGIVLHAPLSVWLGTVFPDYSLLIKSWKELLMLALVPVAVMVVTRRGMWRPLWNDWIIRLALAYALLHVVLVAPLYHGAEATLAGLAIDLRYVLFFVLAYVAVKAVPRYRRHMLAVALAGAVVVVGFATVQLFLPADILSHIGYGKDTIAPYLTVDKNPNYIRVNSTLRGPNPLGAYAGMVLGVVAAVYVQRKAWLRGKKAAVFATALAVCSVIALWISYSRSSLVAAMGTVAVVVVAGLGRAFSHRVWIGMGVAGLALVGMLALNADNQLVSNVLLHENQQGGSSVSSNDGHVSSLATGADLLVRQPFGGGVGSTGSASLRGDAPLIIENQYLFVAHETGWLGLVLFAALFGLILVRLWRGRADWLSSGMFASGVGLALIGLLLPVWVDDTVAIVWWGLAAVALAKGGRHDESGE